MSLAEMDLGQVRVATPCHASWEKMVGDDRARFCGQCQKNVYNLSAMSAAQARQLIEEREGRLCVRFYQRPDGTVLTEDCPVGVRALRRRVWGVGALAVGIALSALGLAAGAGLAWRDQTQQPRVVNSAFGKLMQWLFPANPPPPPMVMGKMCPPEFKERPVNVPVPPAPPRVLAK